jgi:hypothetical protein
MDTADSAYKIGVENYQSSSRELPTWAFNILLVVCAAAAVLIFKYS